MPHFRRHCASSSHVTMLFGLAARGWPTFSLSGVDSSEDNESGNSSPHLVLGGDTGWVERTGREPGLLQNLLLPIKEETWKVVEVGGAQDHIHCLVDQCSLGSCWLRSQHPKVTQCGTCGFPKATAIQLGKRTLAWLWFSCLLGQAVAGWQGAVYSLGECTMRKAHHPIHRLAPR